MVLPLKMQNIYEMSSVFADYLIEISQVEY
jgi:hypothetical protein